MIYLVTKANTPGMLKVSASPEGYAEKVYFEGHELLLELLNYATQTWDNSLVEVLTGHGYKVTVTKPELAVNERIALFCRLYKHFKGAAYVVTPKESGTMRHIQVDQEMLTFYLDEERMPQNQTTWLWRGKQSVSNLYTYQNQVRAAMLQPVVSKHPNVWSREHYVKLDGPGITEYMRHLRSLGLVAQMAKDGTIIDFVPLPSAHGTE